MKRLLLLAGTDEARRLATTLASWSEIDAEVSYAGLTHVATIAGTRTLRGGFGGAAGFKRHVKASGTELVVDATHPFASKMPNTARQVCTTLALPYLRLCRPPWRPREGEQWTHISGIDEAAATLPADAHVLVTSGRDWPVLAQKRPDLRLVVRLLSQPPAPPPSHVRVIIERPPFSVAQEYKLLAEQRCTHLLTKNAGGSSGRSKITAAAALGLEIFVIKRPASTLRDAVEGIGQALDWLRAQIGDTHVARPPNGP